MIIKCLEKKEDENELWSFCNSFLSSLFEKFGDDKTKKFVEDCLRNALKLYQIFYDWYYTRDDEPEEQNQSNHIDYPKTEVINMKIEESKIHLPEIKRTTI